MNQEKYRLVKSIQIVNIFLFIGILFSFFSYIIFNRSLELDGSHNLLRMITNHSFYDLESARRVFYIIQQFPAWIFIHFISSNSIPTLIKFFSFGLIWIHLISFLGCYFILPAHKKSIIFFPLFAFLIGPLTALGMSVSASISVFSYIWFIVFLIYYSDLSLKVHKFFYIIAPLPLLFSHELMSYMAWPLIYLCILKLKEEDNVLVHFLTKCLIAFLLVCSISSIFFIFFPNESELSNRSQFFTSLLHLKFFIDIGERGIDYIYPSVFSAFFLLVLSFKGFIRKASISRVYSRLCLLLLLLFGLIAVVSPFQNLFDALRLTNEEEIRVWVACIALPLSLLIWWLFENKVLKLQNDFFVACIIILFSLTGWRVGSDYQSYQLQRKLSNSISSCKGLINWNERIQKKMELSNIRRLNLFYLIPYSLLIQDKNKILSTFVLDKGIYSKLHFCLNKRCDFERSVSHCYFKKTYKHMCQYFNLYFLDQSRFFNLKLLIQSIASNESYCLN